MVIPPNHMLLMPTIANNKGLSIIYMILVYSETSKADGVGLF